MANVFDPAACFGNVLHKSTVNEANGLAKSLENIGYTCRTKDEDGVGLLLVKGGNKRPRLIVEVNRGNACGLPELAIALRTENPEFGHHYDWVDGVIIRSATDIAELTERAFQQIQTFAGENSWQKSVRENRERDDDESYM